MNTAIGLLIPLLGTMLGASFVFFMKKEMKPALQKSLLGFASGVIGMVAAYPVHRDECRQRQLVGSASCRWLSRRYRLFAVVGCGAWIVNGFQTKLLPQPNREIFHKSLWKTLAFMDPTWENALKR